MSSDRCTRKRLWRWRSNPLRRRDDVLEAWVVLAVWAVVAVGGTLAGLVTAHAADEVFNRQRAERQPIRAVLLNDVPQGASSAGGLSDRAVAKVRWTAPDGSARTDTTLVDAGLKAGSRLVVWQDEQGALTAEPASPTEAAVEAGLLGVAAGLALAGIALGAGALLRWRFDRHRIDQWSKEWDVVGPQWSHRTS